MSVKGKILNIIFFSLLVPPLYAQTCDSPPVTTSPSCPCSSYPILKDNSSVSSGTWCIDGSDPILNNISLNSSSVTVIVCGDVTIQSINFNGGTFIIASGVTVNFDRNVSINTGVEVVNFGTINSTSRFTLNGGGRLFNYGSLNIDRISNNGQIVFGAGSNVNFDILSDNSSCGLCSDTATVSVTVGTLDLNTNTPICNEDGIFCFNVTSQLSASGIITNDNNVFICASSPSVLSTYNSSYDGTATVDVCDCNTILSEKPYIIATGLKDGKEIKLSWRVIPDTTIIKHFEIIRLAINNTQHYTKHKKHSKSLNSVTYITSDYSITDIPDLEGVFLYKVLGWTTDSFYIESNVVSIDYNMGSAILSYITVNAMMSCESPYCKGYITTVEGKLITQFEVQQGLYQMSDLCDCQLSTGNYIIKTESGNLAVLNNY